MPTWEEYKKKKEQNRIKSKREYLEREKQRQQAKANAEIQRRKVELSTKKESPNAFTRTNQMKQYNAPTAVVPNSIENRVNKMYEKITLKQEAERDVINQAKRMFENNKNIKETLSEEKSSLINKPRADAKLGQEDLERLSEMDRKGRLEALKGRNEETFQEANLYALTKSNQQTEKKVNEAEGTKKILPTLEYLGKELGQNTVSSFGQIKATAEHIQGRDKNLKALENAQKYQEAISPLGENINSKFIKNLGMATEGLGQQMPQILLGSTGAGALVGGFTEFSNTYNEMTLENPNNKTKTMVTALLKGTVAGGLEHALGLFGGSKIDDLSKSQLAGIKNKLARNVMATGYDVAGEITEEQLENIIGYVIDKAVNDKNITMEQVIKEAEATFKQTGLTTLLMSALGLGGNTRGEVNNLRDNLNIIEASNISGTEKKNLKEWVSSENVSNDQLYTQIGKMINENNISEQILEKTVENTQNRQATMQNKPISQQEQQTTFPKHGLPQNQFSQVFKESAKKHQIDTNNEGVRGAKNFTDKANLQLEFEKLGKKTLAVYKNGRVIVNADAIKNNPEKVLQNIVLHEAIHGKSGSKELNDVMKTVLSFAKSKGEYESARLDLDSIYAEAYKGRPDFEQLMDEEVVTNTLGEYFGTEEGLNELINYVDDRTTLQKIYDFVKDILNRVTGYKDQEQFFRRVERQLAKALQSDYVAKSGDRFSIQKTEDGGKYVQVDTDQDIFEGKTKKEQIKIAHDYILQKFREQGLIKDNEAVNVTKRTANEYTHPSKSLPTRKYDAKIKASTELDNLLEISKYIKSGKDDGRHPFAKDGWDYYETVFKIGDKTYSGLLNIGKSPQGKLLYDITEIEERADNYSIKSVSVANSSSKFSIASNESNVNIKDNKGRTLSKEQQEYFKESKVRDENGNLLEMYHRTNADFNTFDSNKIGSATDEGIWGRGFYFSNKDQTHYGNNLKNVYLDIKNPFIVNNFKTREDIAEYLDIVESNFHYEPNGLIRINYSQVRQFTSQVQEKGHDGVIVEYPNGTKEIVAFKSNQIKSIDNLNPTDNPDIRYSLSQDTRANIESKIDRYSRIVEEMQQEGRDSDEWTPYANEILRLQDQLEESRYSYQTNGKWQEFVEKYFSNEGIKTKLGDIKLPEKVVKMKDFNDLLDRAINIPQADKKALKSELKGVDLTLESLKEFEQTVNDMDKAYKEINNEILNTNQNTTTRKATYNKYNKYNTEYDNSSLERAKQVVPANKQGRRTKEQWLNVAKQIGTEIANKTNQEIEEIAYRTWQDEAPNQKSSLNRQGEKYVKFTSDEWINTIYNTVKEQRKKLSIDTNKQLPQPRRIVDEVYKEEIAEGKTRKHYQSIFESDQIGETGKEVAKELYKKDTYVPVSNLETLTDVNDYIGRNGLENSYIGFSNKMNSNEKITLQDVALGERLIQIYSENGDYEKVNNLIQDVAILGTELGQQVQALSLIKKASPEGQLQYLQKVLNRTNLKENTDIKITEDMTKTILGSKDAKQLEDNMSKVAIQIANQIPLKASDKIRAWRYLSMLGNPKTHIKNMGANLAMNLTQGVKNKVAGGLESLVSVFNPEMERTKTLKPANKEQREFAKQDAEAMEDLIDAGGKYDVKNIIQSSKIQFDNRVLEAIAKFNSDALDWEDKVFLKLAYKQAMQGYMSANNLKASDMQGEVLEKARQYASLQAQQATFHEFNAVANALSQLENKGGLVGGATSAILPFKKTPMNIAKAGVEYSAIGLGKTLTYDIYQINQKTNELKQQLKDGKITQAQYKAETSKMLTKTIDNMAKGLTGSSIALIGYFLAQKGILKAGNDDEGDEFEEKRGMQEYAVKIGDNTFTLDWVSPTAIPLFTGATIYQLATGKGDEKQSAINSALTGLSKSFEPMTEMSMLQGLTSAITSYEQGSSNMLFDLGASMVTSYAGQFLPTAMGQVARTIDPYERDTSSTKKGIEGKADKFIRQSINKVPVASKLLPRKQDVWGEDVKRVDNVALRYAENALLPWSRKEVTQDRTDRELLSVFDATGENVLPRSTKQRYNNKRRKI